MIKYTQLEAVIAGVANMSLVAIGMTFNYINNYILSFKIKVLEAGIVNDKLIEGIFGPYGVLFVFIIVFIGGYYLVIYINKERKKYIIEKDQLHELLLKEKEKNIEEKEKIIVEKNIHIALLEDRLKNKK